MAAKIFPLDPLCADVIVQRYEQFTGEKAGLIKAQSSPARA